MTKTKKKIEDKTNPKGLTITECPTNQQAKALFLKAVEDGSNPDLVSKVTFCLEYLCSNGKGSFTISDLYSALRVWDVEDLLEVKRIYLEWVRVMQSLSKITTIENYVYDELVVVPIA
jgi:hypothetical protein